jgi:DNA invertase Pin-like site-specific DNA recombinase
MGAEHRKTTRCAIYTRKSTEHGLELEFNSLDAQREACEAYIKSQASQGWQTLLQRYDDPAFSGGNLERPALQKLLKDVEAGQVDVVVVYKIDRLTRSLADFAKLVEAFDAKAVSFVAVTQQFNTTTSMGRLTLNVLLSFAQFERELASERVRDKVAASRKKGKWTGGSIPLGYNSKDKKLVINTREAETVRRIFQRYFELKSFRKLVEDLDRNAIVTKTRSVAGGRKIGGISFTYGPLAYLLKNRTYLGETGHGGAWFKGEHQPIIDVTTFDQVQNLLRSNAVARKSRRTSSEALLAGVIFDDRGNIMSPSYSTKNRVRYRFYVSSALLKGRKELAGSRARVSSVDIEKAVGNALHTHLPDCSLPNQVLVEKHVTRVTLCQSSLQIRLRRPQASSAITSTDVEELNMPWASLKREPLTRIENPDAGEEPEPKLVLVHAIARAHTWMRLLTDGSYDSVEELSVSINLNPKVVRKAIRIAFLAPDITEAILNGSQPVSLTFAQLQKTLPLSWAEQREVLDFRPAAERPLWNVF